MTAWTSLEAPPEAKPRWGGGLRRLARAGRNAARQTVLSWRHPGLTWEGRAEIGRGCHFALSAGGRMILGDGVTLADGARLYARGGMLRIGARSYLGHGAIVAAQDRIEIGADGLIAEYVTIRDHDHTPPGRVPRGFLTAPIRIGAAVWLGAKVTVTRGVTIGDHSIVGANGVVTRDLPPHIVATGAPARVIRNLEDSP